MLYSFLIESRTKQMRKLERNRREIDPRTGKPYGASLSKETKEKTAQYFDNIFNGRGATTKKPGLFDRATSAVRKTLKKAGNSGVKAADTILHSKIGRGAVDAATGAVARGAVKTVLGGKSKGSNIVANSAGGIAAAAAHAGTDALAKKTSQLARVADKKQATEDKKTNFLHRIRGEQEENLPYIEQEKREAEAKKKQKEARMKAHFEKNNKAHEAAVKRNKKRAQDNEAKWRSTLKGSLYDLANGPARH